jgi:hypothetical protein
VILKNPEMRSWQAPLIFSRSEAMACGCAGVAGGDGPVCRVPGRRRKVVTPRQQAEAAMLVACGPRRDGQPWADWKKRRGGVRVQWKGVRWAGVPMPIRRQLDAMGVPGDKLEGCGCIVPLKVAWLRLVRRVVGPTTRGRIRAVWRRVRELADRVDAAVAGRVDQPILIATSRA